MNNYFFNTREDFHYDHSGYYGYIVFNGDDQVLDGLLNALGQGTQASGLGWYRYGKSFRPASDGRLYDWYVRLHSGGRDKPATQTVDDFLRRHLAPARPAPERPPDRLVQDLQQLEMDIASETAAHQEAFVAQQRLTTLLDRLQGIDTRISEDLEQLGRDLQDIADTWHTDDWSELSLGSVVRTLDSVNDALTRDLANLQRDHTDIAGAHADTLRARDEMAQVLERIKDHDRHISEDLTRLQQDVQRLVGRDGQKGASDGQAALLERFDTMEQSLGTNIRKLERAVQAGTAAQTELEEAREALQESQGARSAANAEIDRLRETLEKQESASQEPSAIRDLNQENDELKKVLASKQKEHREITKSLRQGFREEKRKITEERDRWQQLHSSANDELREYREAANSGDGQDVASAARGGRMTIEDLQDVLTGAFPGLVLVEDSLETLYIGIENYRPVMALLQKIVNDKHFNGRNAIRGDRKRPTKWREDIIDKGGRVYFCKESNLLGDKIVTLISDKNHQTEDLAWLRKNPPDMALKHEMARR